MVALIIVARVCFWSLSFLGRYFFGEAVVCAFGSFRS